MCIFSKSVEYVAGTNIFARPSGEVGQYLVYSMTLKADSDLSMILPIQTPKASKEDAVKFINLDKYSAFFEEIRTGFPLLAPGGAFSTFGGKKEDVKKLKAIEVGSFVASFVPTVKDFSRLDEQFRLPVGTWDKLPQYGDYGFAVFKLKKGEHRIHPMAFLFPRANPKKLFFPTVHIHDGKVHDQAEFDHALYCQGVDTGMKWDESSRPAGIFMRGHKNAKEILDVNAHVYRKRMVGTFKNEDVWL